MENVSPLKKCLMLDCHSNRTRQT